MKKSKIFMLMLLLVYCSNRIKAEDPPKQDFNPLTVGVPSLTIAPDARGGGMGDIGAATDPDLYSQYWNPAKYAFAYSKAGIGLSYTPWLRSLVKDIDLLYLAGYYKLGDSDNQAIGASLRYFSLGQIDLSDELGPNGSSANPYEMALDVSYSVKATENFSMAAAFRYIYSDLGTRIDELYPGTAWAADISGYYNTYLMAGNSECLWGLGFNVSNIGSKISYDEGNTNNFLPTNLRLGTSFLLPMDDYNTLSFNLDANKYLIPTPPSTVGLTDAEKREKMEEYYATSPVTGVFKSFSDAPGGASEEFREIMWSFGAEYAYDNKFFVRGGYFYEDPNKGNRQYFSLGTGFKMTAFQMDIAYLISTVPSNPLDQTLRFSLSFDMDGLKNLVK